MKKLVFSLLSFLILSAVEGLLSKPVSAHMPGQPSFFLINGKYADLYPWPSGKLPNPDEPQDIAPEQYQINQDLTFEIDFTKFSQNSPEQFKKTKFYWKYGDDTIGNGSKNTHAYTKPGTYVLKILADDGTMPSPQLFESVEITIVGEKPFPYATIGGVVVIACATIGTFLFKNRHLP